MNNNSLIVYTLLIFSCKNGIVLLVCVSIFSHIDYEFEKHIMIIALLLGSFVGFVLAMPPGPVAITSIRLSLDKSMRDSVAFGLAAGFMDFLYCAFAIFSMSAVMGAIGTLSSEHSTLQLILQLVVIAAVLAYGFVHIRKKPATAEPPAEELKEKSQSKYLRGLSRRGPFFLGIAIALANVANPTFIPFLMYIMVWINSLSLFENYYFNNLMFALGFGFGNFFWLYLVGRLLTHYKNRLPEGFISRINKFAGLALIGCGTFLGYRVLFPRLSELLKFALAF